MINRALAGVALAVAFVVAGPAGAGTVLATDPLLNIPAGTHPNGVGMADASAARPIHGSATVQFSAPLANQWLTRKTAEGVTGIGIWSRNDTEREIERGEQLLATFSQGLVVTGIRLGLLFDGPEFGDVQEKASITATFADKSKAPQTFTLTALYNSLVGWTGLGTASLVNGPNTPANGGVWDLTNPFGSSLITSLSFTALRGTCATGLHCSNQSDFVLMSVTAVPEPATVALMLAGLGVVGAAARRRALAARGATSPAA